MLTVSQLDCQQTELRVNRKVSMTVCVRTCTNVHVCFIILLVSAPAPQQGAHGLYTFCAWCEIIKISSIQHWECTANSVLHDAI